MLLNLTFYFGELQTLFLPDHFFELQLGCDLIELLLLLLKLRNLSLEVVQQLVVFYLLFLFPLLLNFLLRLLPRSFVLLELRCVDVGLGMFRLVTYCHFFWIQLLLFLINELFLLFLPELLSIFSLNVLINLSLRLSPFILPSLPQSILRVDLIVLVTGQEGLLLLPQKLFFINLAAHLLDVGIEILAVRFDGPVIKHFE